MMKKPSILMMLALGICSVHFCMGARAQAQADNVPDQTMAYPIFLNAITICPAEQNPLKALKDLHGNSFGNVHVDDVDPSVIRASVVSNPQLMNPRIMAPTRLMGNVSISMYYPRPGLGLVCLLEILPRGSLNP